MLQKFVILFVILLLAPTAFAGVIEAEDASRVVRIPDNWTQNVSAMYYYGWKPWYWYNGNYLFTIGQHNEQLLLNWTGTSIAIKFFSFRSGKVNYTF